MVCLRYTTTTTTTIAAPAATATTTAIEVSPVGSSPYTSTYQTNKNKTYINELIQ